VPAAGVVDPCVEAPLSSVNTLFAFEQPYNQNNPLGTGTLGILLAGSDFPGD